MPRTKRKRPAPSVQCVCQCGTCTNQAGAANSCTTASASPSKLCATDGASSSSIPRVSQLTSAANEISPISIANETSLTSDLNGTRVEEEFFVAKDVHELSKALLGMVLVRQLEIDGQIHVLKAKIVETEAYPGKTDKASHSFKGKTDRNAAMFMRPGTVYVYNIYGTLQCINISAVGEGAAVLIRAAEPVQGLEIMRSLKKAGSKPVTNVKLCNGPSKLCQVMAITKESHNQTHCCDHDASLFLEYGDLALDESQITSATRIGIDGYGPECADQLFRYYVTDNPAVSVIHKNNAKRQKT